MGLALERVERYMLKNPTRPACDIVALFATQFRHTLLDMARKERHHTAQSLATAGTDGRDLDVADPTSGKAAQRVDFLEAIALLPDKQRAAYELKFAGYDPPEIAKILNIDASTARRRITAAELALGGRLHAEE